MIVSRQPVATMRQGQAAQVRASAPRRRAIVKASAAPQQSQMLAPSDMTTLGRSDLKVPVLGVGAWSWGDRSGYWGYGREYGKEESRAAYKVRTCSAGWIGKQSWVLGYQNLRQ